MSSKSDDSFTPRSMIQGILENNPEQVEHTVRVTRHQTSLLNASQSRSSKKRSSSMLEPSGKKSKPNRSRLSASMNETTPRTLITGFLGTQDSEKTLRIEPRVTRTPLSPKSSSRDGRGSRRKSLLRQVTMRSLQRSVSEVPEEPTPRTLIRGIIQEAEDETPVVPVRQRRRSSIYEAQDPMEITVEKSPLKGSQQSISMLEDSFMGAYSQPSQSRRSQRLSLQQRANKTRVPLSPGDFVASIQGKLSQSNRSRRGATQSQLEDISEMEESQRRSAASESITTLAQIHAEDVITSDDELSSVGALATQEEDKGQEEHLNQEGQIQKEVQKNSQEEEPDRDILTQREEIEREEEGDVEEKGERHGNEEEGDMSDMSEDFSSTSHQMSARLQQLSEDEAPDEGGITKGQDETITVNRQAASHRAEAIISARSISVQSPLVQPTEDVSHSEKRPDNYAENPANMSNHSLVPPSENEDETDSPEGLPGFNSTFKARSSVGSRRSTLDSTRQTTLDTFMGYASVQKPVLPFAERHAATPEIPPSLSQHTRPTPAEIEAQKKSEAQKKRPPFTAATSTKEKTTKTAQKRKPTKKSPVPSLPSANTHSIFKHFTNVRVTKEALLEVEKVANDYWKNLVDDIGALASHAGRRTVDESDMQLLMHRQRITSEHQSMYTLVEKYFPLEYQVEIIDVAKSGNKIVP